MRTFLLTIIAFCYGSYWTAYHLDRPFVERKQAEVKETIIKFLTSTDM